VQMNQTRCSATGMQTCYGQIGKNACSSLTRKPFFSFILPNVKKTNLKSIVDEFLLNLNLNLQAEGFPIGVISKVMQEYSNIRLAKTESKQVLGSMNEIAFQAKFVTMNHYGGIANIRILGWNKEIKRIIMGAIKYHHPMEKLRELLLGER